MSTTFKGLSLAPKVSRKCKCVLRLRLRLSLLRREHDVRPHHFVVFMFQNVTVPDVAAWIALETSNDPCDHTGFCSNGIFPPCFCRVRRNRRSGESDLLLAEIAERFEFASIQNLKSH